MATQMEEKAKMPGNESRNSLSTSEITKQGSRPSSRIEQDIEQAKPANVITDDAEEKEGISRIVSISADNTVDWNDPQDPRRPINWSLKKKWANCGIISVLTFLTPFASSIIAPAMPLVMKHFNSTDQTVGALVVSIYILGFAIGPLFIAPLSEMYGRVIMYHICNVHFVIWSLACALAPNIGSLLVFRLLAGMAGSCPITIFAGSIADVFVQEERGFAMSFCALGPLIGPIIGPVAGGFLSEAKGWRWCFWLCTIASGAVAIFSVVIQRETCEHVLLQRLTDKLRKETGNQNLRSKLALNIPQKEMFKRAIVRPTKMLFLSPIVLFLSIYIALVYGYLYLLFTTLSPVFEGVYHFGHGVVGLAFLGFGVGAFVVLFALGHVSDKMLKQKAEETGEMKPEYRLPGLIPGCILIPIGLFWYGWSCEKHIHWMMPIVGTGFVGAGLLATFMPITLYLTDAFSIHAASAIAANTVLRSLVGALIPLAGPKLYASLGLGWGNSLLGFIALAFSPMAWIFFRYGEVIRTRYPVEF